LQKLYTSYYAYPIRSTAMADATAQPLAAVEGPPAPSPLRTSTEGHAADNASTTITDAKVESPSLSTPSARARFEFEYGLGNEGTKVLMVEWEDDETTKDISGWWTVGWENKSHVLPAEEKCVSSPKADSPESSTSGRQASHRLYFLLPAHKQVPATVTLTLSPTENSIKPVVWRTNPLPAIFPPGLGNSTIESGGKGVLHTLWAKRRIQTLEKEIEEEAKQNCEGIALQIAIGEKEWIMESFGISTKSPPPLQIRPVPQDGPLSPMTPLSPGGSRLTEKLRGLKLQTTAEARLLEQPLTSPDEDDIAVPLCQKKRDTIVAEHVSASATAAVAAAATERPANPKASFMTQSSTASMMSLGSVLAGQSYEPQQKEEEDELFALPLSPRSPEMLKSPFSFAADDTTRYLVI
jgi:hypothetical protein